MLFDDLLDLIYEDKVMNNKHLKDAIVLNVKSSLLKTEEIKNTEYDVVDFLRSLADLMYSSINKNEWRHGEYHQGILAPLDTKGERANIIKALRTKDENILNELVDVRDSMPIFYNLILSFQDDEIYKYIFREDKKYVYTHRLLWIVSQQIDDIIEYDVCVFSMPKTKNLYAEAHFRFLVCVSSWVADPFIFNIETIDRKGVKLDFFQYDEHNKKFAITENIFFMTVIIMTFIKYILKLFAVINCRNIELVDRAPSREEQQFRVKRKKKLAKHYMEIKIKPFKKYASGDSTKLEDFWSHQLKHRMGHPKTYTEERKLFGKVAGTFWWNPIQREGTKQSGKTYKNEVEE